MNADIHTLAITEIVLTEIRAGSFRAFEVFFTHYYIRVRTFAEGMLKSREEAENIAQNVFLKIWLNRDRLSTEKHIDSYVFMITRNEVYDFLKHEHHYSDYKSFVEKRNNDRYEIESEYDIKEIKSIVNDTVENMPEQRKRIYLMSRRQYLSNDEIAEKLGISKRTVEKHISLALAAIRENLGDFFFWIFIFFLL